MADPETAVLDEEMITPASRLFTRAVFARFPELRLFAKMERSSRGDDWGLLIDLPAPSGDANAQLVIWDDGGQDPSVGFGSWHTHEDVWGPGRGRERDREELLDLVEGILTDRFVHCEELGEETNPFGELLDMSEEDAILETLTSKYSTGRVRLRSWSGRLDKEIAIEDLERGEPA